MNSDYEIVQYHHGLNARILVHGINHYKLHWHREIELILVLKGDICLTLNGRKNLLAEDDVAVINSEDIHSTMGNGDNCIAVIQINPDFCAKIFPALGRQDFLWNIPATAHADVVRQMRFLIAFMIEEYRKTAPGYQLSIEGLLNNLTSLLVRHVPMTAKPDTGGFSAADQFTKERIKRIIDYVHEHYAEKISLPELADNIAYVSTYYLSHFFKEKIGISFLEYLTNVRLKNAVHLLYTTRAKVSDIAMDCGFGSIKAFNTAFKKQYAASPNELRRQQDFLTQINERSEYLSFDTLYVMQKLQTYLSQTPAPGIAGREETAPVHQALGGEQPCPVIGIMSDAVMDDAARKPFLFSRWQRLASVGRAYDLLREDLRAQVREAACELGVRHLRFHGIFSDEMRVVSKDARGKLLFCWDYVDHVFDFLVAAGVSPLVDCTFMPAALKSSDHAIFWYKGNVSPPADIKDWARLIRVFAAHCIERYGARTVRDWYFEVWNEPDLFWTARIQDYFPFFEATVNALRQVDPLLRIAGPSALQPMETSEEWLDEFFDYVNSRALPLDCFTFHLYGENNFGGGEVNNTAFIPTMGGKDYFSQAIALYREKMRRLKQPPEEIFITEFNLSAKHGNYLLDTMFAACFALYNYLQNRGELNGIAYWTLSDIFEEDAKTTPPFGGSFGLVTREGIKKSAWWALWFLEQLKGAVAAENIGSDEDVQYCITQDEGTAAVLAFNYVFYDKLFIKGDSSLLTYRERYNCFEEKSAAPFAVELQGLTGTWELREYTLDREHGSAFDLFVAMGMPQALSREDAAYLRAMSRPALAIKRLTLNGTFNAAFVLPPHGIKLLLLKKIYAD